MTRIQLVEQLTRAFAPLLAKCPGRDEAEHAWKRYCVLCDRWDATTTQRHPSELPGWLSEEDRLAASWAICLRYCSLAKIKLGWLPVKGKFAKQPRQPSAKDQTYAEYWKELDPTVTTAKLALSEILKSRGTPLKPLPGSSGGPGSVAFGRVTDALLNVLVFAGHLTEAYEEARARALRGNRPHATDFPSFRRPREAALKRRRAQIDAAYRDVPADGADADWHKHVDWSKLGPESLSDAVIAEPSPWARLADEIERTYRMGLIHIEDAQRATKDAARWLDAGEPRPLQRTSVQIGSALAALLGCIAPVRLGDDGMGLLRGAFAPLPPAWSTAIQELNELRLDVAIASADVDRKRPSEGKESREASDASFVDIRVKVVDRGTANTRALEQLRKNPAFGNQPARVWQETLGLKSEGSVRHLSAWKNRMNFTTPRRSRGGVSVEDIQAEEETLEKLIDEQAKDAKSDGMQWGRSGRI